MSDNPDERPSFLVIMTEQHRGDCLGADGHPMLLTPTLDAIGAGGVRFRRAYSTCPVCVPARRSFLTGQFPGTHGVLSNANVEWDGPTLPGELTRAGYQTEWIGRSMHQTPVRKRYGYQHMVFMDHRVDDDDYDEFLARRQPEGAGGYYGSGVQHNDWTARPWHMDESLHMTNWTVNEGLRFLRNHDPSCPFFLTLSFLAAHPPLIPPACYMDRYLRTGVVEPAIGDWAEPPADDRLSDGPAPRKVHLTGEALRSSRAAYYGLINHLDDQIRRLFNVVDGVDRLTNNNTVVVFFSDHGEMLGDHYLWAKTAPYEGAARVPMMIRAPERFGLRRRSVIDTPVCLEDIMPTVLEMAGVDVPDGVDGQSLLAMIRGERSGEGRRVHMEHPDVGWHAGFHCLTDGREKYVWFTADGREQLFDLVADPTECHDLAGAPAAAERLAAWRVAMVAELTGRPEGFSDGARLVPGRPYPAVMRR